MQIRWPDMNTSGELFPKASTERIVELWNSEKYTIPKIAIELNMLEKNLKSKLKKLQKDGVIKNKNKLGKLIENVVKIETKEVAKTTKKKVVKKKGLEEMMAGIMDIPDGKEEISVLHKEMLIEILWKLIVN